MVWSTVRCRPKYYAYFDYLFGHKNTKRTEVFASVRLGSPPHASLPAALSMLRPNPAFRLFEQNPSRHYRKGELFPRVHDAGRWIE